MITPEQIGDAILEHGALAVYNAAAAHMTDSASLHAVGLQPETLGDVNRALSVAYQRMTDAERAIENAAASSALRMIGDK